MSRTGNLRGGPLFLRPSVVRTLLDDVAAIHRPAERLRLVEVPVLPIKLVDRPRASENPQLAKANDDPIEQPVCSPLPVKKSGVARMAARESVGLHYQAQATAKPRSPNPTKPVRKPARPQQIATAETKTADPAGGCEGRAPEGTSGSADGVAMDARECSSTAHPAERMPLPIKGFHRQPTGLGDLTEAAQPAPRPDIRSLAEKLAAKRAAQAAKIDPVRLAAAYAREAAAKSTSVPAKQAPLVPAPSREECRQCGIPGWKGCDHYLPCADPRVIPARAEIYPTGGKGSIGVKRPRSVISL